MQPIFPFPKISSEFPVLAYIPGKQKLASHVQLYLLSHVQSVPIQQIGGSSRKHFDGLVGRCQFENVAAVVVTRCRKRGKYLTRVHARANEGRRIV